MWKDLSENTSLTPSSRTFCKPQGLWIAWEERTVKEALHSQWFPTPQKEKMNWKEPFLTPQETLLPSHSQVPAPVFEESLLQETRSPSRLSASPSQGWKWILDEVPSPLTHIPNLVSAYYLSWLYSDLACSFFHLAQFWSLWNLNLGLLGGVWTSNWTAISPRLWDGSSADQRTTLKGVNGKFHMHFNRLVVRVETIQICGSWAFMLVILIVAWLYTKLYKCQITWETCQLPRWTALLSWYFSWVWVSVQPRPLHAHI